MAERTADQMPCSRNESCISEEKERTPGVGSMVNHKLLGVIENIVKENVN